MAKRVFPSVQMTWNFDSAAEPTMGESVDRCAARSNVGFCQPSHRNPSDTAHVIISLSGCLWKPI